MTYRDLFSHAQWKLDHNEITLGEYEEMTKPLNREVDVLDKIRADIEQLDFDFGDFYDHTSTIREMVLEVIDKYKGWSEKE